MKIAAKASAAIIIVTLTGPLACCAHRPKVANLAGHDVIEIREGIVQAGVATTPKGAAPMALEKARPLWLGGGQLRAEFDGGYGTRCEGFASTAHGGDDAATAAGVSVSTPGNHPTPAEEIWYCDADWVVRLSLARCQPGDATHEGTFRVVQAVVGRTAEVVQ